MKRVPRGALVAILSITIVLAAALARGAYVESKTGWQQLTEAAEFSPRDSAQGFQFDGQLWLSNGYFHGNQLIRDLWKSPDGRRWQLVSDDTPYDGYSPIAVINGRLAAARFSTWSSPDGRNWQRHGNLPGEPNLIGSVAVHQNKAIYVRGSYVFSSEDGITWNQIADSAPFGVRQGGSLISLGNYLLFIAGAHTTRLSA